MAHLVGLNSAAQLGSVLFRKSLAKASHLLSRCVIDDGNDSCCRLGLDYLILLKKKLNDVWNLIVKIVFSTSVRCQRLSTVEVPLFMRTPSRFVR